MSQHQTNSHHEPRKNWWQRNWKWFVPTGCLSLIAMAVLFVVFIFYTVTSVMKQSTPYVDALEKAVNNEFVIESLGEPIEQDGILQGNISIQNNTGEANISIPLEGPKGSGTVYVVGRKYNGKWTYDKMVIYIDASDETIDLLE